MIVLLKSKQKTSFMRFVNLILCCNANDQNKELPWETNPPWSCRLGLDCKSHISSWASFRKTDRNTTPTSTKRGILIEGLLKAMGSWLWAQRVCLTFTFKKFSSWEETNQMCNNQHRWELSSGSAGSLSVSLKIPETFTQTAVSGVCYMCTKIVTKWRLQFVGNRRFPSLNFSLRESFLQKPPALFCFELIWECKCPTF